MAKIKLSRSYKEISSLNLGADFVREANLAAGKTYPITVEGMDDVELSGTLQRTGLIGGLAAMYRHFPHLPPNAEFEVSFDGTTIHIQPPGTPTPLPPVDAAASQSNYVLDRKDARRIHILPYDPASLNTWEPKGEPDVYMVFGRLAQFTEYRYCCASSKEVLNKFGIDIDPKPDAILVEEGTDRYIISEFEVVSSSFLKHGHKKDDIDLIVCWKDDETDPIARDKLPKVLALHKLLQDLLNTGEIEI